MKTQIISLSAITVAFQLLAAPPVAPDSGALKWDAEAKECTPKPGETAATFTFCATNVSSAEVSITSLITSCGCTVAQLPQTPYALAPGSNVTINVSMDIASKMGRVTKSVKVDSTAGFKELLVTAHLPAPTKTETK